MSVQVYASYRILKYLYIPINTFSDTYSSSVSNSYACKFKVLGYNLNNVTPIMTKWMDHRGWFHYFTEHKSWLSGRRLPSCRPRSSWLTVSRQYDAGHPSYDDVTRQSICRRQTACREQPSSCHPWSVTVAVNLRKAAENLFICLRVAALVTYELAPWKCTD